MKLLRLAAWTAWFTLSWITLADAGPLVPIFTAIGTFLASGTILANLVVNALLTAAKIGLSLLSKAKKSTQQAGVSADMKFGGDNPLSFVIGSFATPGQLEYANTWGEVRKTPNAYLTHVISAGDLPMEISGLWVDDKKVTLPDMSGSAPTDQGWPIADFQSDSGSDYLWVRLLDGTQTATNPLLLSKFGSDPDRPVTSDMIWRGVPLLVITARLNQELFNGFPQYLPETPGIPLYDPRKDSSVGGSGSQRWNDWSTWEPSDNTIVQAYNILRGIHYEGEWVWGGRCEAWQLPLPNLFAAMNASDTLIDLDGGGQEKQFRSGLEITVDQEPAEVIETLLKGCNGRFAEVGGIYKFTVGAPGAAVYSFTDETIVVTEGQSLDPFPGLEQTFNGAQASYPEPAEKWAAKDAPAYLRSDLEVLDDNRQLVTGLQYPSVPYAIQVQRLLKAAIEDARRFKVHQIILPPEAWLLEPNDVVAWTSARNSYVEKKFIVTQIDGDSNFLQYVTLKEVDPADYSWDPETDQLPYSVGFIGSIVPPVQEFEGWAVEQYTFTDAAGNDRRPGILVEADGDLDDVEFVRVQVRRAGTTAILYDQVYPYGDPEINSDPLTFKIEFSGILPATDYEARGLLEPNSDRLTEWSDWLSVTTPDVRLGDADVYLPGLIDEINDRTDTGLYLVGEGARELRDRLIRNTLATVEQDARNVLDKQELRENLTARAGAIEADYDLKITAVVTDLGAATSRIETLEVTTVPAVAAVANSALSQVTIAQSSITALGEDITDINVALPTMVAATATAQGAADTAQGAADAANANANTRASQSAFDGLVATVTDIDGDVEAHGDALTMLTGVVGDYSTSALIRIATVATEAGASSTVGISVAAAGGAGASEAAILISAVAGGKSTIGLLADYTYFRGPDGSTAKPIVFVDGVAYLDEIQVRELNADEITVLGKFDANEVLQDGTLITDLMKFKAVTDFAIEALESTSIDPDDGWVDHLTISIPARDVANPIDLDVFYTAEMWNFAAATMTMRIVRRVSGVDTEIPPTRWLWTGRADANVHSSSFYVRCYDFGIPTAAFEYVVQANYGGILETATITANVGAVWWKR